MKSIKIAVQEQKYFDFSDVIDFLCSCMNIETEHFTSYDQLVGGDKKDFEGVWKYIVEIGTIQGEIVPLDFSYFYEIEDDCYDTFGDWVKLLFDAMEQFENEIREEYDITDTVYIKYS